MFRLPMVLSSLRLFKVIYMDSPRTDLVKKKLPEKVNIKKKKTLNGMVSPNSLIKK